MTHCLLTRCLTLGADRPGAVLQRAAVLTTALAVPSILFGRGAMQALLALALVLALAAAWRERRLPLDLSRGRFVLVAVGIVAIGWLPSILVSLDPGVSLLTWGRTILLTLGALVLWTAIRREDGQYRLLLKVLLLSCAVASLAGASAAWLLNVSHPIANSMKYKASAFGVLMPVVVWAGFYLRGRWLAVSGLAAIGILALVVGTNSRSGLAGLLVGAAVVALAIAIRHRRWWIVVLGGLALLFAAAKVKPWEVSATDPETVQYDLYLPRSMFDAHRQVIWRFTFHKMLEKPVFGWGINVINQSPGAGQHVPGMLQEYIPSHPHSWLVEVSAETGIVGFLLLVGAVLSGLWRQARAYFATLNPAALAGLGATTVFWSAGAFNFSIWAVWWQLVLMIALALVWGRGDDGGRGVTS